MRTLTYIQWLLILNACIDDVGMEAHAPGLIYAYDRVKQAMMLETDRPHALREAIMCCRNGGTIAIIASMGSDRIGSESHDIH